MNPNNLDKGHKTVLTAIVASTVVLIATMVGTVQSAVKPVVVHEVQVRIVTPTASPSAMLVPKRVIEPTASRSVKLK